MIPVGHDTPPAALDAECVTSVKLRIHQPEPPSHFFPQDTPVGERLKYRVADHDKEETRSCKESWRETLLL